MLPRAFKGQANVADYRFRDDEIIAGPLIGWNLGEGHLHNEQLLAAVQRRCHFDDGGLRVIVLEGQPIHRREPAYRILSSADISCFRRSMTPARSAVLSPLNRYAQRRFPDEMARAWVRHNIEEVGQLEHLLPQLSNAL